MDTSFLLRPAETTRRDFIKLASASLALLGLSQALTPKVVGALESTSGKPAVIWLEGQDCGGRPGSGIDTTGHHFTTLS